MPAGARRREGGDVKTSHANPLKGTDALRDQWLSAMLWCLGAIIAVSTLLDALHVAHISIAPTAHDYWEIWRNWNHPHSLTLWGVILLALYGVLRWQLAVQGLLEAAAPPGTLNLPIVALAVLLVGMDFLASEIIDWAVRVITGQAWLPVFRPGYEYTVTLDNLFGDLFSGVIAAPLYEELAFRGLLMGCLLARGWRPRWAILYTAALFAITHVQYYPSGMLMVFVSGVFFGYLRYVSGGLYAPMLAHALLNLTISLIDLHEAPVSVLDG